MGEKNKKARVARNSPKNEPIRPAIPSAPEPERITPTECPVVGFGASAGGLEAFTEVLQHIPKKPRFALVLVQHLDPKHASILSELLSRSTRLPVLQVKEGMSVQPDHVYVIPPNSDIRISRGALHLEPRPSSGQHMPIDRFFQSLAQDQGAKAIGVILSGTASDGTLGLKAIKAEGGITFAQDVHSAKYDGMPRSAMAAGCVDFVLPPDQIARELLSLCQHRYLHGPEKTASAEATEDESAFSEVFAMLRSATGVDFASYKPGTIRRRTLRRMALHKMDQVQQYARYLKDNRGELQLLFQDILINVTGFFREPATFDGIKARVLPGLFKGRAPEDAIRVWVPGCATGEEAYSIAVCLLEYMHVAGAELPIQIFGTDLSEPALEKARAGLYPESIAADVSTERLRRFFVRVNSSYQITRSVRDVCIFARQNVTKDPPFSKLDLILCRNLLIYLGPALQATVMRLFHYALRPKGFLVLGVSESVGNATDLFAPQDKRLKIYSRKQASGGMSPADFAPYDERTRPTPAESAPEEPGPVDIQKKVDQLILARHTPPAIVVDRNLQILQFRGQTSPYIEHTSGEANLNLMKMTPSGLGLEVRKLIPKAEMKNGLVTSDAAPVTTKNRMRRMNITVTPIQPSGQPEPLFLVVLEEVPQPAPAEKGPKGRGAVSDRRTRELEHELSATREYLQAVIEEQEAASEELKSAHEEVQSGNEELQSTNEELLTAKEELQSTNEELTTVNEEMQSRNAELQQLNNDLLNLLSSVTIPIIMLGNDLRIRRFTPQAEKILNLLATDIGRPISDFRIKVNIPDLATLCQDVIDDLHAREREVQDAEGRTYSMWVRPYRTADNKIDGVVLALFDITERRQSAEARYRRLFEASMDGIIIADADTGEIVDVNPFVTRLFGYPRSRLIGVKFWESDLFRGSGLDQSIIEALQDSDSVQKPLPLPAESGELIETEVVCNRYGEGEKTVIQFNIRDLSSRKRMEEQLRREDEQLRQAQKMDAVGRLAGGVAHDFNNLLTAILGYCDLVQQDLQDGNGREARGMIEQIRISGERAAMLTRQLLAFGRKQVVQPAIIDPNELVTDMRQLMAVTLTSQIHLELNLARHQGRVKADRGQIEQVILNLVFNARDAMPNGGKITVETADVDVDETFSLQCPAVPAGKYVMLTVKDTGAGMDTETQTHLFEPFFTTKPKGKGVGLGLSTVYNIVKQSNGYIWAYSELGVGTTFRVYLPRVEAQPEAAAEHAAASEPAGGTETVLLVEDEPAIRNLARRFLEQRGYHVLDAAGGPEALRAASEHHGPVHLLLTDVVMPSMSGRELAFHMAPERPEMKVLYMSGHTEDMIVHHGVLNDQVPFLQKPFSRAALTAKVREVLDRES
jgi:two-component system CheB/CheR fusion protein